MSFILGFNGSGNVGAEMINPKITILNCKPVNLIFAAQAALTFMTDYGNDKNRVGPYHGVGLTYANNLCSFLVYFTSIKKDSVTVYGQEKVDE